MSLLRSVDKALKNINKSLSIPKLDPSEKSMMLTQLNALEELKSYIESGSWLRKDARQKFSQVLACNFDYSKVADLYKTTPTSIRVSVSIALNRLEELIGKDIVTRILKGDPEEVMRGFRSRIGSLKLSEIYSREVLKLFPHPEKDNILSLQDCEGEADLLAQLSLANQKKKLLQVDQTKVAHLLGILKSNKEKDLQAKKALFNYIEGSVPWETVVTSSKRVSIYTEDAIFDRYIFNRLAKEIAYAKVGLYNSRDSITEESELKKLRALRVIEDYVKSYKWLPDDGAKVKKVEVLSKLFETNYDYQTVAEIQDVSIKQMESLIARESNRIIEMIGHNTLDLIVVGQVELGLEQFFTKTDLPLVG